MKFLTTNLCANSSTSITASSTNTAFPVSNLKNPFRSKRWRSTGCSSEWVLFDMRTREDVDSVVILWPKEDGIRLTDGVNLRIQANDTNVWTSPAVNQSLTVDNTYMVASYFFNSIQSYRYWRVSISDSLNPYSYVELGVVWIGKSIDIENAQNGFKFLLKDTSKVSVTDFGHEYVDEYPQQTVVTFDYRYLSYSAVQTLEEAFRLNGSRDPVLVAFDPDGSVFDKDHFLIYGKMSDSLELGHVNYNLFNTSGIKIRELA